MSKEFYDDYFRYIGVVESPSIYHRWCAISLVSALLGRNVYIPFGHGKIFPNMYLLLVGSPGTRKGAALGPARNVLRLAGYKKLAPERISPERFLIEMQQLNSEVDDEDIELEKLDWSQPCEMYVVSDEFGDFIKGNVDFVRMLTTLWDNLPFYRHPKIHGRNVYVHEPTLSIIGATTPRDMALTLPIEAIGQGFLSRFILIHSDPTGIKIPFPKSPAEADVETVVNRLLTIKNDLAGEIQISAGARELCEHLYIDFPPLQDQRFQYYNTRRYTHLLKTAMVLACMDGTLELSAQHVLHANTLLYVTEHRMSKALGEFGKAKNADVANAVIEKLTTAKRPVAFLDLWRAVAQDLNKQDELRDIISNLRAAEKLSVVRLPDKTLGYVPCNRVEVKWKPELLDMSFLRLEERI